MKDKYYFGIGTGENALYKTLDNGETWEIITQGGYKFGDYVNGRIIYASTENKGLSYSDDGGTTRKESNITEGSWGYIIYSSDKKYVYASSLDNKGIVISYNDGETWEWTNIRFGDFNCCWDPGRVTFGSNNGGVYFKKNVGVWFKIGFVVTPNGSFSTMPIPANIVPVINKIIAPQIFSEVTGESFKTDIDGLNLLVQENNKLFINSENYYTVNIDWENDVGMKPFNVDISALLNEGENLVLSEIQNHDTETMKKTMQKVKTFIDAKKVNAIKKMAERVTNCNIDSSNLLEIEATKQQTLDAIETEKMYEGVLKASVVSVMTTIYNRIFSLSDATIRKLIYAGIYETIIISAGSVKKQLDEIINSGGKVVKPENFNISYDFSKGLKVAINKYLNSVSNSITVINNSNDKDLIGVAVDFYKSNRQDYIYQASSIFNKIKINLSEEKNIDNLSAEKIISFMLERVFSEFRNSLEIEFKYFTDELKDYETEDKQKIYGYLNAIYKKFEERLLEYTKYIYDQELDLELIIDKIKDILSKVQEKEIALKEIENFFLRNFKSTWVTNKEFI
jgi:hypothetical protein